MNEAPIHDPKRVRDAGRMIGHVHDHLESMRALVNGARALLGEEYALGCHSAEVTTAIPRLAECQTLLNLLCAAAPDSAALVMYRRNEEKGAAA